MTRTKKVSTVSVLALTLSTLAATPSFAAKGGVPDWEPCSERDGVLVCPYDDDEPGEYVENFYSGDWGTAGGAGIIIGPDSTRYWDAHVVYKLDQEAGDVGVHDVVVQDSRVNDTYNLNLRKWIKGANAVSALNITQGDCDDFPEANCISVIDFTHYDKNSNVAGYMVPQGLHARGIAFNDRYTNDKKALEYSIWHEGGHALGLSHKHSPDGVMSYHRFETQYSDDEVAALQLAYGEPVNSGGGNKGKGQGKNSGEKRSTHTVEPDASVVS